MRLLAIVLVAASPLIHLGGTAVSATSVPLGLAVASSSALDQQATPAGAEIGSGCPRPRAWYQEHASGPRLVGESADWFRAVIAAAGLPIVAETGTAFVICAGGHDLFVSGGFLGPPGPPEPNMRRADSVGGTRVFANNARAAWRTRDATIWVHEGPSGDSFLPGTGPLRALVRASLGVVLLDTRAWPFHRKRSARLRVRVPDDWHVARAPLIPGLKRSRGSVRFRELFAAGTFGLPPGSGRCGPLPQAAVEAMKPDDAFLVLYETTGRRDTSGGFFARPKRLQPWSHHRYGGRSIMLECVDTAFSDRYLRFVDAGRIIHAYLAWGPEASHTTTRTKLWAILNGLRFTRRAVRMSGMPAEALGECRAAGRVRTACPTRVPRAGFTVRPNLFRTDSCIGTPNRCFGAGLDIFDLQWRAEDSRNPRNNRPPRLVHLAIYAGKLDAVFPETAAGGSRVGARGGLMLFGPRASHVQLGTRLWNGTAGSLTLAPPHPLGGQQGNHLIYRWQRGEVEYALGLHAWEPFTEAIATLRETVESIP